MVKIPLLHDWAPAAPTTARGRAPATQSPDRGPDALVDVTAPAFLGRHINNALEPTAAKFTSRGRFPPDNLIIKRLQAAMGITAVFDVLAGKENNRRDKVEAKDTGDLCAKAVCWILEHVNVVIEHVAMILVDVRENDDDMVPEITREKSFEEMEHVLGICVEPSVVDVENQNECAYAVAQAPKVLDHLLHVPSVARRAIAHAGCINQTHETIHRGVAPRANDTLNLCGYGIDCAPSHKYLLAGDGIQQRRLAVSHGTHYGNHQCPGVVVVKINVTHLGWTFVCRPTWEWRE